MDYWVLTIIAFALILSGIAIVFILQSVFDRAFDKKLVLVYNQVSNFVNGQTKELQKQIDDLRNKTQKLEHKRGKCERCEEGLPRWDQITDPGFDWDKQVSRQRRGDTWAEGKERDPS